MLFNPHPALKITIKNIYLWKKQNEMLFSLSIFEIWLFVYKKAALHECQKLSTIIEISKSK